MGRGDGRTRVASGRGSRRERRARLYRLPVLDWRQAAPAVSNAGAGYRYAVLDIVASIRYRGANPDAGASIAYSYAIPDADARASDGDANARVCATNA